MAEGVVRLQKQAARILASLEKEIARKEKEIVALREEVDICVQILGKQAPQAPVEAPAKGTPRKRIDWAAVLDSLPDHFTGKDVADKIKKPPAAAYTRLYHMVKTGRLNRTEDGYEKV